MRIGLLRPAINPIKPVIGDIKLGEKPVFKVDIQSFVQFLVAMIAILGFIITWTGKITALENRESSLESSLHEVIETQKTLVNLFNAHLISDAGQVSDFRQLQERVRELNNKERK